MVVIIGGSRTILDSMAVIEAIKGAQKFFGKPITKVLSGGASGPDTLGASIAKELGIPVDVHPAQWSKFGRRAGFVRNAEMVDLAEGVIAVWDGKSRGTAGLIQLATTKGLPTYVHRAEPTYNALTDEPVTPTPQPEKQPVSLQGPSL